MLAWTRATIAALKRIVNRNDCIIFGRNTILEIHIMICVDFYIFLIFIIVVIIIKSLLIWN